ncbi:hypothetical protein [Streptomyces sp. NL15-2K]|uniref:hypothetical protein n=1 Tax=Streptomyces sp. NL15-2K TaxID=376149 RepID=UPI000F58C549|nr:MULTISPECIES: hypothetical protein [Actinomycetes]WKX11400.1 hypothetical protein Q4V64_29365 [Kutzneria buriramensis]GCB47181.1 hypothetical protein SNL152K_4483 [Streptomyces sp. NL15-2K]
MAGWDQAREAFRDFGVVAPGVVHWKENGSDTEPVRMLVAQSTQEVIVVNLDDRPCAPAQGSDPAQGLRAMGMRV